MSLEDIEALLNQYGYPCQNDSSKECSETCPFRLSTPDVYAKGLIKTGKTLPQLEEMLKQRQEALVKLSVCESGAAKATFEDAATAAALQVKEWIVKEEVYEGKRRPCFAYPDAGPAKRPRRKRP